MAGIRGKLCRALGGKQRSVYFSTTFGVWPERGGLHVTMLRGRQSFHTSLTAQDGLLYDVFQMLYDHAKAIGVPVRGSKRFDAVTVVPDPIAN